MISLLVDVVLLLIYMTTILAGDTIDRSLHVNMLVAIGAAVNGVCSIYALSRVKEAGSFVWGAINYGLLVGTVGTLIAMSGGINSPYIALWLMVGAFGGMFGLIGIGILGLLANGYIAWCLFTTSSEFKVNHIITLAFTAELPLIVSYIIWHKRITKTTDVTSDLEKRLTQTSNRSEVVVNSIADGVITVDPAGTIQLINPAAQRLLGWDTTDALGLHYESVLKLVDSHEQGLTPGQNPLEQVRITKQPLINNELTLISNAGKKMLVSLVVSPILDEAGAVSAVIVVVRDITSEKAHEREQAEFVSTASHEMRTPVAAIEGYLGLALNPATAAVDEKGRMYLEKAQEAVKHLGRLFQDLLTVSRAEDNRLEQHPEVIDIVEYSRSIFEGHLQKAADQGLGLVFAPGDAAQESERKLTPIFYVNIDRDHYREVLSNLIENAIKYTREGKVVVDITGDDKLVTVSVTDSGIGIAKEDVPHLFQKFYRVDNSATREIGGTGLGLYITRRLMESMGGKITVESTLGKGSTFNLVMERLSSTALKQIQDEQAIGALNTTQAAKPLAPQSAAAPMIDAATTATGVQSTPAVQPAETSYSAPQPVEAPQPAPSEPAAPSPVFQDIAPSAPVVPIQYAAQQPQINEPVVQVEPAPILDTTAPPQPAVNQPTPTVISDMVAAPVATNRTILSVPTRR